MEEVECYIYKGNDGETVPETTTIVEFSPTATVIRKGAFLKCVSLTTLAMPDWVTAIEDIAFYGCQSITKLHLSSALERIGPTSFFNCLSLPILHLPPSLHTIDKQAFRACRSIREIATQQQQKEDAELQTLSLTTISEMAFLNCHSLASIPHHQLLPVLRTIASEAFSGCRSLTEVTLGSSITSAARNSFEQCSPHLVLRCTYRERVILPWAVTHVTVDPASTAIHTSAFAGCHLLHSIALTPAITKIGASCFYDCRALLAENFILPDAQDNVEEVGVGAFAHCSTQFLDLQLPPQSTQDTYTFVGGIGEMVPMSLVRHLVIHETVTDIDEHGFKYCRGGALELVIIESQSIHIKEKTFNDCGKLREVTFVEKENGVICIEPNAFYKCPYLYVVNMPKVVNWILEGTFTKSSNTNITTSLLLPTIHQNAFKGCPWNIVDKYNRYTVLKNSWDWIASKSVGDSEPFSGNRSVYISSTLNEEDLSILSDTFSLQPPAPTEVKHAIVRYLQEHDLFFSLFPHDLVQKMLEYVW